MANAQDWHMACILLKPTGGNTMTCLSIFFGLLFTQQMLQEKRRKIIREFAEEVRTGVFQAVTSTQTFRALS